MLWIAGPRASVTQYKGQRGRYVGMGQGWSRWTVSSVIYDLVAPL